jgi:hypothetical protein
MARHRPVRDFGRRRIEIPVNAVLFGCGSVHIQASIRSSIFERQPPGLCFVLRDKMFLKAETERLDDTNALTCVFANRSNEESCTHVFFFASRGLRLVPLKSAGSRSNS